MLLCCYHEAINVRWVHTRARTRIPLAVMAITGIVTVTQAGIAMLSYMPSSSSPPQPPSPPPPSPCPASPRLVPECCFYAMSIRLTLAISEFNGHIYVISYTNDWISQNIDISNEFLYRYL